MVLFTILLIMFIILMAFIILGVATAGAGFVIIFGDVIVCIALIAFLIKILVKRRKR